MEQLVLTVGTVLALSFGAALLTLEIKSTIGNARFRFHAENLNTAELLRGSLVLEGSDPAQAVRGYDTPELYRDDTQKRLNEPREDRQLH